MQPKRRPAAMRMISLSTLRPQELIGYALSQSPLCPSRAARRRAVLAGSLQPLSSAALQCPIAAASHDRCLLDKVSSTGVELNISIHLDRVRATLGSGRTTHFPNIALWRVRVAAAEAKKAEGASNTTLRTPRPPSLIGREAWIHASSVKSQLMSDDG